MPWMRINPDNSGYSSGLGSRRFIVSSSDCLDRIDLSSRMACLSLGSVHYLASFVICLLELEMFANTESITALICSTSDWLSGCLARNMANRSSSNGLGYSPVNVDRNLKGIVLAMVENPNFIIKQKSHNKLQLTIAHHFFRAEVMQHMVLNFLSLPKDCSVIPFFAFRKMLLK
jgi:hypothetical protein